MVVKTKEDQRLLFPDFFLCGNQLEVTDEIKYQGYSVTNDLSDNRDMFRQQCKLYGQANMLAHKFYMYSAHVKGDSLGLFALLYSQLISGVGIRRGAFIT